MGGRRRRAGLSLHGRAGPARSGHRPRPVDPTNRDDPIVGVLAPVDLEADAAGHENVRIFIGYAGWGPAQLDGEIAHGDWMVVDALVGDVVTSAPDTLWRDVLRRQRGRLALFATAAEDPTLN